MTGLLSIVRRSAAQFFDSIISRRCDMLSASCSCIRGGEEDSSMVKYYLVLVVYLIDINRSAIQFFDSIEISFKFKQVLLCSCSTRQNLKIGKCSFCVVAPTRLKWLD